MLDKSLTLRYLIMTKTDTDAFPKFDLPEGYTFKMYEKGDENLWADIEISVGQFSNREDAIRMFNCEFVDGHNLALNERIVFVLDKGKKAVATGALWNGLFNGKTEQRLHWIAVDDSCKGKGIAKALVSKLLTLYGDLGYQGFIYLITETWCYSAVNIYTKFGFKPYLTNNPVPDFVLSDEDFVKDTSQGWKQVESKINEYRNK